MWLEFGAILAGFAILIWSADRFVDGAAALAYNLGVSPLVIGLTIVGFGTSAPEILVSGIAAFNGNPGLAIGNAIGSNIANVGLILGITAIVAPLVVRSETLRREYPIVLGVSILAFMLVLDGELGRIDGIILLLSLVVILYLMWRLARRGGDKDPMSEEYDAEIGGKMSTPMALVWLLVGLGMLLLASRMLVWGASEVAAWMGVSDLVIGLTIVALGTSLPELGASIASALKNEPDLAIGNVIGSNIYNLLAVFSLPGLIAPGVIETEVIFRDMPVMLALTLAIAGVTYSRKGTHEISRFDGMALLAGYFGYQVWIIFVTLA